MADPIRAQELKAKGNALFGKGEWSAAYETYAEAIQHDDQNAVLHANRAACAIHLGKFAAAKADAQRAVTLDPKYTKAWGRLASACNGLLEHKESAECWRKALATFPSGNLTPAEQQQKQHCEGELRDALLRADLTDTANIVTLSREYNGLLPWDRAKALEAELEASLPDSAASSAWVILRASKLWDIAMENMEQIREMVTPMGTMYGGRFGVIGLISDAVLTDQRVFRMNGQDWVDTYHKQLSLESTKNGAWLSFSSQAVKQKALERQQLEGWSAVRPAVDITVRGWLMRAFSANRPGGDPRLSLTIYDSAMEILNWGRAGPWKSASTQDKGVIFEDYFVRAVRRMRLDAFVSIVGRAESHGPEDIWKRILEEAQSLVGEMPEVGEVAVPPGEHEPGFVLAYGVYPKATAATMLGLHAHHMGWLCLQRGENHDAVDHLVRAYFLYYNAAKLYPQDDEKHVWFLAVAIQLAMLTGGPIEVILGATEEHRVSLQLSKKIWANSVNSTSDRDNVHTMVLQLAEDLKKDLADGKIKREDLMPSYYKARDD